MATAAPAPAAAPVAGQPAAAEAGTGAGETPIVGKQARETGEPTGRRPAGVPKLPGVMEDGPEVVDRTAEVRERVARERGPDGKFVKAAGEPTPTDRAGEPTPEPPPETEPKQKFRFLDKDYATQREAELAFKSEREKLVPVQRKLASTESELEKASHSAREWHKVAQQYEARIAELEAGAGQRPASPDPQSELAEGGIDWGLYADIVRAADAAGTPEKAHQWLVEQIEAQRQRDIAALRKEAIEDPRQAAEAEAQLVQTADTLVASMAAHRNADGSPAFPELMDGPTNRAHEVGALWVSLGLDPHLALSPGGAVAAVALFRMAQAMSGAANASATPPTPPAPDLAGDAAATLEGGRASALAAGEHRSLPPEVARLVSGLKNPTLIRPGLGFEA